MRARIDSRQAAPRQPLKTRWKIYWRGGELAERNQPSARAKQTAKSRPGASKALLPLAPSSASRKHRHSCFPSLSNRFCAPVAQIKIHSHTSHAKSRRLKCRKLCAASGNELCMHGPWSICDHDFYFTLWPCCQRKYSFYANVFPFSSSALLKKINFMIIFKEGRGGF